MELDKSLIEMIRNNILSEYNYKVSDITNIKFKNSDKARAVYKVETDNGAKCLKKVYYNKDNLLFVYSVTEWLNINNILCPKLLSTRNGHKFVSFKGELYILTNWIEGRKCDYDNESDIRDISHTLARIHNSSYGFKPIQGSSEMNGEKSFYLNIEKHHNQLLEFYRMAKKMNDNYSKLYLQNFEYNSFRAEESLKLVQKIDFTQPIGDRVSMKAICHLDYVNKNIIFNDKNKINVIDFDNTRMDMPVHDVCYYLRRIMKREKTDWDFNIFLIAINSYNNLRTLSHDEYALLYALLAFPHKYWKLSRDYYKNYKVCNHNTYINMLKKVNNSQIKHQNFCEQFKNFITI